jgi:pimeloyl-ACP methyl ester carboxylesterase
MPTRGVKCGWLAVPENHAEKASRRIRVAFYVLPAYGQPRSADPILVLLGGPGDAATHRLRDLAGTFRPFNRSRDVILVDQRGTGRSSPLGCAYGNDNDLQSYMDFLPEAAVRACVASLPSSIDVSRYGTSDFVADLEALRAALGVEHWNLQGGSYGSRVALEYMERHPRRIRSAILVGVVPSSQVLPEPFGRDAARALRMLIADCRSDSECGTAFPRFEEEVDSIARRLERAPVQVRVPHPVTGAQSSVLFSRAAFGEVVRASMYTAHGARVLPLAIHEAYLGNYTALAVAHVRRQRMIAREGWTGLYLAVTCPEDIAHSNEAAALTANRKTILGEYRARQHFAACAVWHKSVPKPTRSGRRLRTPILMLVGDRDPVTPPAWAKEAHGNMESARLVVVPSGGHGFFGMIGVACLDQLQHQFLEEPVPATLDVSCVASVRPPPFLVRR